MWTIGLTLAGLAILLGGLAGFGYLLLQFTRVLTIFTPR